MSFVFWARTDLTLSSQSHIFEWCCGASTNCMELGFFAGGRALIPWPSLFFSLNSNQWLPPDPGNGQAANWIINSAANWGTGGFLLGTWYHLAITVDMTGLSTFYINGAPVSSFIQTAPPTVVRSSLYLGKCRDAGCAYFAGAISDFQFALGSALTTADVRNLYLGVGCPSLQPVSPSPPPPPPVPSAPGRSNFVFTCCSGQVGCGSKQNDALVCSFFADFYFYNTPPQSTPASVTFNLLNPNNANTSWLHATLGIPTDYCTLPGVTCANGFVTQFGPSGDNLYGLAGRIPDSIAALSNLTNLAMSSSFTGTLPQSIGSLTGLMYLLLGGNRLSGTIPTSFGSLVNLKRLDLSQNQLSGTIPQSFGSLLSLQELSLQGNALTGTVPLVIANLILVWNLLLNNNFLTGDIHWLSTMVSLSAVRLHNNLFTGASMLRRPRDRRFRTSDHIVYRHSAVSGSAR